MTQINDEEQVILAKKYAADPIYRMPAKRLFDESRLLLLKIHVITGWVVPADELRKILADQFMKKLYEDYAMLNTEEIEFAFRKEGTSIKDWGKEMNLNLVDQVLIPYLNSRLQASATEEKLKSKPPAQRIYTDEEILNERRRDLEAAYQCLRRGRIPVMFDYFPEILVSDGFIKAPEEMSEFFVKSLNEKKEALYVREI